MSSVEKIPIQRPPASTFRKARVDLDKTEFDALIENKGYDAYIDKAIKCPCLGRGHHARLDCVNCLGTGWIFIDRTKTKLVSQSMDTSTKYEGWSELNYGQARITARDVDLMGFMDRVTIIDGSATTTQVLEAMEVNGSTVVRFIYDPKEITDIYVYAGADKKLQRLIEGTDYSHSGNTLTLSSFFEDKLDIRLVARYTHSPQFHVVEMYREAMTARIKNRNTDQDEVVLMPVGAIARRSHYVFDEEDFLNFVSPDNSSPTILGGIEYVLNFGLS